MVQEIIYTSAEKGLKQGSRGFCTVVSTAGLALNLAERLEAMSGYRPAFPLHDPRASLNPVCYSHVTTRIAGKTLHVISRVADAGQDYTGRSNKLAHHVVVDHVSSFNCGPVRLMSEPGTLSTSWDGTVRQIAPRTLIPPVVPAVISFTAWKAICGDEGWAGAVAEMLLKSPAPVSVIFNPGTDTLTLVREVLDLIPAAQRWEITFSTYFTRLLAGAECQLRFVLNDTPEATALRNDARARLIDLAGPVPAAAGGTLVDLARRGVLNVQEAQSVASEPGTRSRNVSDAQESEVPRVALPPVRPQGPIPLVLPGVRTDPTGFPDRPVRPNHSRLVLMLSILFLLLASGGGAAFWFLTQASHSNDKFAKLTESLVPAGGTDTDTTPAPEAERAENKQEPVDGKTDEQLASDAELKRQQEEDALRNKEEEEKKKQEMHRQQRAQEQDRLERIRNDGPFAYIRNDERRRDDHQQWLFELPHPKDTTKTSEDIALPLRIHSHLPELSLCKTAQELFRGAEFKLVLRQSTEKLNTWTVFETQTNPEMPLAEYILEPIAPKPASEEAIDCLLHFQWLPAAGRDVAAAELLRWWPLQIKVGDRTAVVLQRKPERPLENAIETTPTWKKLTESRPIPMISTAAIQAVPFDQSQTAEFTVEIGRDGQEPQQLSVHITKDDSSGLDADVDDVNYSQRTTRYFMLTLPLTFLSAEPMVEDGLLGFGEIQLKGVHKETGLELLPRLSARVRLPEKGAMNDLPNNTFALHLKKVINNPPQGLEGFNSSFVDREIQDLETNAKQIRNDSTKWWTIGFDPNSKLPTRKHLEDVPVFDSCESSVRAVRVFVKNAKRDLIKTQQHIEMSNAPLKDDFGNTIPSMRESRRFDAKVAAIDAAYVQAQRIWQAAKICDGILPEYQGALDRVQGAMRATIQELLADYESISIHWNDFVKASASFQVRCTLSGPVPTPGCDNGEEIRVYFLETGPPRDENALTQGATP